MNQIHGAKTQVGINRKANPKEVQIGTKENQAASLKAILKGVQPASRKIKGNPMPLLSKWQTSTHAKL